MGVPLTGSGRPGWPLIWATRGQTGWLAAGAPTGRLSLATNQQFRVSALAPPLDIEEYLPRRRCPSRAGSATCLLTRQGRWEVPRGEVSSPRWLRGADEGANRSFGPGRRMIASSASNFSLSQHLVADLLANYSDPPTGPGRNRTNRICSSCEAQKICCSGRRWK